VDAPRRSQRAAEQWQVVMRQKSADEVPAHRLVAGTLTDPIEDDEDTAGRVGEVIAVLALGVMEHHWGKVLR
jgi:hypothetical protein